MVIGGQGKAWASAGCTALNGTFAGGVVTGSTTGTGFDAGDVITLTVTTAGGADTLGLYNNTAFSVLLASGAAAGTRTFTVPANTGDNFIISGVRLNAASSFAWSCAPGGGTGGGTASQKLTSVQTQGSTMVATTSSAAITGAVSNAIGDALMGSGSLSLVGSSERRPVVERVEIGHREWIRRTPADSATELVQPVQPVQPIEPVRFAAEPRSDVARRTDEAFAALGYAGGMPVKAPAKSFAFTPEWSVWRNVAGSGFRQSDQSALKGSQINATAGLSYKLRANAVIGVYAGYENFNYDFASLTGNLKGNGGSIGTYAGWDITPTLRWKGMVGWTGLSYDASAATAAGSFTGSRWLFSTGLTGTYFVGTYKVEPSASIFVITERQTGYTDTLGVAHAARDFSTGRVSLGSKVTAPSQAVAGLVLTPYAGLYGDWSFRSDSARPAAGVSDVGIGDGWAARLATGVTMPVFARSSLALGGEYGGIGANYKIWTGTARLTVPF